MTLPPRTPTVSVSQSDVILTVHLTVGPHTDICFHSQIGFINRTGRSLRLATFAPPPERHCLTPKRCLEQASASALRKPL